MPITVYRHGDGRYQAVVSPPEGAHWRSSSPVTAWEILERLSDLGCHSTDITDALYAADPGWAEAYDNEVLAHRQARSDPAQGCPPRRRRASAYVARGLAALPERGRRHAIPFSSLSASYRSGAMKEEGKPACCTPGPVDCARRAAPDKSPHWRRRQVLARCGIRIQSLVLHVLLDRVFLSGLNPQREPDPQHSPDSPFVVPDASRNPRIPGNRCVGGKECRRPQQSDVRADPIRNGILDFTLGVMNRVLVLEPFSFAAGQRDILRAIALIMSVPTRRRRVHVGAVEVAHARAPVRAPNEYTRPSVLPMYTVRRRRGHQ